MAYIRCWTCAGNGMIPKVQKGAWGNELCPDCKGTGCDKEATKDTKTMLESEKTYPNPILLAQKSRLKENRLI